MRILHTADWHLGQSLNGWPRDEEHARFFKALHEVIAAEKVDALLVAGDIFDGINPSGEAQRLLYTALLSFLKINPKLQIVMISGNHDAAARLEAPEAMFNALGIHVLGTLRKSGQTVDLDHHLVPLKDANGTLRAYVLAIPFLRQGDLPGLQLGVEGGAESAVTTALRSLHHQLVLAAEAKANGLPLLAMGHLTCMGGEETSGSERRILIGGEHAAPANIFPPALRYVALGHLHKPQNIDGGRLRYAGSPFPLSASEINYNHGVSLLDLDEGFHARHIPIQRPLPIYRLPKSGSAPLEQIAQELTVLPDSHDKPFVYLNILADRPSTQILQEVEALLAPLPLRLAGLSIHRPEAAQGAQTRPASLSETSPEELFKIAFQKAHGIAPEQAHLAAFRDALSEV